jgi:predicted nuclease with TOPRIM domain
MTVEEEDVPEKTHEELNPLAQQLADLASEQNRLEGELQKLLGEKRRINDRLVLLQNRLGAIGCERTRLQAGR